MGARFGLALGIHNIYNRIEYVMLSLADHIDRYVPTGESAHQDLLDQMSSAIDGKRPALLDTELYGLLVEFKGFRHVVRHRYGFDLDLSKSRRKSREGTRGFPGVRQSCIRSGAGDDRGREQALTGAGQYPAAPAVS
jgi:hypothetical protein